MYEPKEDSFLLSESLKTFFKGKKFNDKKFLDMGSGSGIQAETLKDFTKTENITCVDLDSEVIEYLKKKGFHAVHSNLFSNTKEKFDFIVFNPPYLPEHKYDKQIDTTGGKKGDETILEFLKQAKKHLNKGGKIFLLLSSFTPRNKIFSLIKKDFNTSSKLSEKKMFFETLEVWVLQDS